MSLTDKPFDITSIIEKLDAIEQTQSIDKLKEVVEELKCQYKFGHADTLKFDKAGLLYQFTQEALVVIRGRQIIDCTPAFARISGYSCQELRDRDFLDTVHADYITDILKLFQLQNNVSGQYAGLTKSHMIYFAEIHINKMSLSNDTFFALVRDITNQKKLEEQLRESESKFKNLANTTSVAIMLYQGEKWVYANPAAEKISGYTIDELKKMNYWSFVAPEYLELIKNRGRMRQQGEDVPSGYEFKIVSKSGVEKWVYLDGKLTLYNGKPAGLISIIEITRIKNVELSLKQKNIELLEIEKQLQLSNKQLHKLNAQLQQQNSTLKMAKERAEESDRLKSAFLANMSHEIRTPMNAIMGFSEILANSEIEPKLQKEFGQTIYNRSQHLLQIINDIVDISKIEANLLTLNKTTFDLNAVLSELRTTFTEVLRGKNKKDVALEFSMETKGIFNIYSDKHRLEQILSNLIDNAIKFTDKGKILVLYQMLDNHILEFFIQDTGIGIPPSGVDRVFDRFVMANNAVNEKHEGTGLGLAISKSLANLLGGDIVIDSTSEKGTVFRVFINIEHSQTAVSMPNITKPGSNTKIGDKRILIVEDDKWSANYLRTFLKDKGFHVAHTKSGEETLSLIKSGQKFDLILLDIKLPGIDGLETVTYLKTISPATPIIAQTAYALNEDRDKALAAGCDDYIAKPIDTKKLMELIIKHLHNS